MRSSFWVVAAIVLLASATVHAQSKGGIRYKWHDGEGLVHFSDSLNAQAMKYGYDLINDHGMVVGHVARQLTAEEREAANKIAVEEARKARLARDAANADAQMLAAYPDEESYKISLQQTLQVIDQRIHTTQINLRSQEKALTDLLGRAAAIETAKDPIPKSLADSIAERRGVVTDQRDTLHRQQALRAETVKLQVGQLARYRELKAAQETAQR